MTLNAVQDLIDEISLDENHLDEPSHRVSISRIIASHLVVEMHRDQVSDFVAILNSCGDGRSANKISESIWVRIDKKTGSEKSNSIDRILLSCIWSDEGLSAMMTESIIGWAEAAGIQEHRSVLIIRAVLFPRE